jgi:hypothetical protein
VNKKAEEVNKNLLHGVEIVKNDLEKKFKNSNEISVQEQQTLRQEIFALQSENKSLSEIVVAKKTENEIYQNKIIASDKKVENLKKERKHFVNEKNEEISNLKTFNLKLEKEHEICKNKITDSEKKIEDLKKERKDSGMVHAEKASKLEASHTEKITDLYNHYTIGISIFLVLVLASIGFLVVRFIKQKKIIMELKQENLTAAIDDYKEKSLSEIPSILVGTTTSISSARIALGPIPGDYGDHNSSVESGVHRLVVSEVQNEDTQAMDEEEDAQEMYEKHIIAEELLDVQANQLSRNQRNAELLSSENMNEVNPPLGTILWQENLLNQPPEANMIY